MTCWISLFVLTGCLVEQKTNAPDFTCAGRGDPASAPEEVRVDGVVLSLAGDAPIPGVEIDAFLNETISLATEIVTDEAGRFSFSHRTERVPTSDSIQATKEPDFIPTRAYPGAKVAEDSFLEMRMVPRGTVEIFAMDPRLGIDPTKPFTLVRVSDCNQSAVAGGTIEPPSGVRFYLRSLAPDPDATETDASGLALIVNMDAGPALIRGAIGDIPLRDNTVEVRSGEFVQTLARP